MEDVDPGQPEEPQTPDPAPAEPVPAPEPEPGGDEEPAE